MKLVGIGIDLVDTARIRAAVEKHGEAFLNRVFTPGELAHCSPIRDPFPHYAARFAAKEAVGKALGTGIGSGISWQDIEIESLPSGQPIVRLHGTAQRIAAGLGADSILLSLTHTDTAAAASALAFGS